MRSTGVRVCTRTTLPHLPIAEGTSQDEDLNAIGDAITLVACSGSGAIATNSAGIMKGYPRQKSTPSSVLKVGEYLPLKK
jgi:hypothetical protein